MKLTDLALHNHQFTVILILILLLFGITGYLSMPRSEDPFIEPPNASVFIVLPGGSPEDLEKLILEPLDREIRTIDEVKHTDGVSRSGAVSLGVESYPGTDQDDLINKIEEKIAALERDFPEGIVRIEVVGWSSFHVKMAQIALVSDARSMRELNDWADKLERLLDRNAGLKSIQTFGNRDEIVSVSVHPERISAMGLSLVEVIGALEAASVNMPGGFVNAGDRRFTVKTSGDFESLQQIRKVVVGGDGASPIYLSEVADIEFDYADRTYLTRVNGRQCVLVTAMQKEGTNVISLMKAVREDVARFSAELPPGMQAVWVFDQSDYVSRRLSRFFTNLLQGIVLVGAVILLVLGFRSASIVMITIPLSFIIALGWMASIGYAVHQMTIAAMVLSLGLLVDNSIVVTENINSFLLREKTGLSAAAAGTRQVGWAVVSATATTILAFVPIAMMRDVSGDFIRSMPVSVMLILAASLLVALTVTPLLSSRILKPITAEKLPWAVKRMRRFIAGPYLKVLNWCLNHRLRTILITVIVFVVSIALFPIVGVSFFPKADKTMFLVNVSLPKGSTLDATDRALRWVEDILVEEPDITCISTNLGRGQPSVYYNKIQALESSSYGQIFVQTKQGIYGKRLQPMLTRLRSTFSRYPGARIEISELEQGPGTTAPIVVRIHGDDTDVLDRLSKEVEEIVRNTPGTINVGNPLGDHSVDLKVEIDRDRAALLGARLDYIDLTVRTSLAGWEAAVYRDTEGDEYPIRVRLPAGDKASAEDFSRIYIPTASKQPVQLAEVAEVQLESSPAEIRIRDGRRIAIVTADITGTNSSKVESALQSKLKNVSFPPDYSYDFGGQTEARGESFSSMYQATIVAIVGIYAVLVLVFGSFRQPLIIFTALPLAFIGAVLGLLFSGNTFSFTAFVGLTSLVGIVVNNSILLVDRANQLRKEHRTLKEAVTESGASRFIPIVLTTATTVLGLLPLTLTGGTLWAPLGWVIIGGLTTSTVLTLIVVPVLYDLYSEKTPR